LASFSAFGKINRQDWGVSYGAVLDNGGLVVSNDVNINIEIEAREQKEESGK
jgi:polyisoprenoid-binding protein YceI